MPITQQLARRNQATKQAVCCALLPLFLAVVDCKFAREEYQVSLGIGLLVILILIVKSKLLVPASIPCQVDG